MNLMRHVTAVVHVPATRGRHGTHHSSAVRWWGVNLMRYVTAVVHVPATRGRHGTHHSSAVRWWGMNLMRYVTALVRFPATRGQHGTHHSSAVRWWGVNLMRYATGSCFPSSRVVFMRSVASPSSTRPFFMSCHHPHPHHPCQVPSHIIHLHIVATPIIIQLS